MLGIVPRSTQKATFHIRPGYPCLCRPGFLSTMSQYVLPPDIAKYESRRICISFWTSTGPSVVQLPRSLSNFPWWRHEMETFCALLALCEGNPPVAGGFASQRPVTRSFDVVYDVHQDKRLIRWLETPWCSCYVTVIQSDQTTLHAYLAPSRFGEMIIYIINSSSGLKSRLYNWWLCKW